jgi:glutamate synthase (NADPH/NADH) small chain
VHQLELLARPPDARTPNNPWPLWPTIFRVSTAHEEGGDRLYAVATQEFVSDGHGRVEALRAAKVETVSKDGRLEFNTIEGSEFRIKADLVLLAMGFLGPERNGLLDQLGVRMTDRGTVWRDERWMTSVPGVFTAGDMQRGQSLIVWAIAEGRSCARGVDAHLMGTSELPAPLQ